MLGAEAYGWKATRHPQQPARSSSWSWREREPLQGNGGGAVGASLTQPARFASTSARARVSR